MSIQEKEAELIAEFDMFGDWTEKYEYLIELGKELPLLEEQEKTEEKLIKGCQSRVWLKVEKQNDLLIFKADSDAIITKGIVAVLIRVLSEQSPKEIIDNDFSFVDRIGLREHLSPTRSNGLVSMLKQMKLYAIALAH